MDKKRAIERATAEAFLDYWNRTHGTSFRIMEHGDAPDIVARDDKGRVLQLEIVLTEDRPGDIKRALGSSGSGGLEDLRRHVQQVREGKADPFDRVSRLDANVSTSLIRRLRDKMMKRYGANTALVIRDTSGVDWNWGLVADHLKAATADLENPFDQGIWVVNRSKDRVIRIL